MGHYYPRITKLFHQLPFDECNKANPSGNSNVSEENNEMWNHKYLSSTTPPNQYTQNAKHVQILHKYQAFCVYSLLV